MTQQDAQKRLSDAINAMDEQAVEAAIADGADVNLPETKLGELPLWEAINLIWQRRETRFDPWPSNAPGEAEFRSKVLRLVKLLVRLGADVNAGVEEGEPGDALHWAVFSNEPEIARFLLEAGANPSAKADGSWLFDSAATDLIYAITRDPSASDASDVDTASPEAFIAYIERKNMERGGGFSTDVLKLLRQHGAKASLDQ